MTFAYTPASAFKAIRDFAPRPIDDNQQAVIFTPVMAMGGKLLLSKSKVARSLIAELAQVEYICHKTERGGFMLARLRLTNNQEVCIRLNASKASIIKL